ncbi:MAG: chorismate mutase [Candidatus Nanopelagicales bacterium]|jgi:chorismate mutase|nr:chorismate mutase [Candidatus Nanopelagicales bacterium]MDP4825403.1 chorismate mutase [Candidatus Nanopelagicales bacterium]MDP4887524.1 chorismate mutase [Candidatus Nanopelagicales bacterium]
MLLITTHSAEEKLTMTMRGVRGAVMLSADDADEMQEAVLELLTEMMVRNDVSFDDFISILFTSTPDLHCAFPAAATRTLPLDDVPLICAQEIDVAGAPARVVRILAHVDTDRRRDQINHVYLRGAQILRQDLAQ